MMRNLFLGLILTASIGWSAEFSNIILISLDTTRADHLSCYGHSERTSPNIDAIARKGMLFAKAYTPVPLTLPAHASMLTGCLPAVHGIRHNGFYDLPRDIPVLAELLRSRGYDTAAFVSSFALDSRYGLARGFNRYDDTVDSFTRERPAEAVTEKAIRWLSDASNPFFLWVHFFDPHEPYDPPSQYVQNFTPYDGEIAYMDHQVGKLLEKIYEKAGNKPFHLVIVGDHGEMLGEHDEDFHGRFLYESAIRVPMIWVGKGIPPGNVNQETVSILDIFPTLLELTGIRAPLSEGTSLVRLFKGNKLKRQSYWMTLETYYPFFEYGWVPLFGVTNGKMKWIRAPEPELYDLENDPDEKNNLQGVRDNISELLDRKVADYLERDSLWRNGFDRESSILDSEAIRNLQSLGYLSGGGSPIVLKPKDATIDPKKGTRLLDMIVDARNAFSKGDKHSARVKLLHVLKQNPNNHWALGRGGEMLYEAGFPGDAAVFFQKAIDLYPNSTEIDYTYLARALERTGSDKEAMRALERALELEPGFEPAAGLKAHILYKTGRINELKSWLDRCVNDKTVNPYLLYYSGGMAMAEKDYVKARAYFHRVLSMDEQHAPSLNQLASIAFEEGEYVRSAHYLNLAVTVAPDNFTYRVHLAGLYKDYLKQPELAIQHYRQALSLSPTPQDAENIRMLLNDLEKLR